MLSPAPPTLFFILSLLSTPEGHWWVLPFLSFILFHNNPLASAVDLALCLVFVLLVLTLCPQLKVMANDLSNSEKRPLLNKATYVNLVYGLVVCIGMYKCLHLVNTIISR